MVEKKIRTTIFLEPEIIAKLPDRVNRSGLIRDLLKDYVDGNLYKDNSEWKEGFKELYTFFQAIMKDSDKILKQEALWNDRLMDRNLQLIDKLKGEL